MSQLQVNTPTYILYLTDKVKSFKAGCIADKIMVWSSLTTDTEILSTVSGLPLEFESRPDQQFYASKQNFTSEESKFIGTEINNLLQKNVIKESLHEPGEFISPIFLRPKNDGSFRLILNLKKLNKFMPKIHFKMDTIHTVTELIHESSYMTKIDLKDAYYSIPINNNDKKYLKFMHKGKLFHFTCLPNGLSCGPRKFTKLLKPALTSLRTLGINIIAYIDDLIIIDDSYQKCVNATQICVSLFDSLGFVIHPEKSNFTPATVIEYLGFSIDAINQTIQLTDSKKNKTKDLCQHVLSAKVLSIRQVAKLLGTLTSAFPGVKFGPLHYRSLERCKIAALKKAKGNFDANMLLSQLAAQDIQWWINNIESSVNVLSLGNASIVLTTDASKTGWGAVTSNSSASGQWKTEESTQHINCLELTAVLFGLKSLLNNVKRAHIKILSDNTTTVACINKMGTTHSESCNRLACEIWDWAISHESWLTSSYIPGKQNTEADKQSRKSASCTEWKLKSSIFQTIIEKFKFVPDIDLFASRINCQLDRFVSYTPDPNAFAVNAFTLDWSNLAIYAFPPFSCVGKMVRKIIQDKAKGIIIVPNWPSQSWFSMLQKIKIEEPFFIFPSKHQLYLPSKPQELHPLHKKLELLALHVSGTLYMQ